MEFQKPGFWNKRSLGQNFLINPHIIDKLITVADINKNDTIVEVGPGTGNLTKKLAEKAKQVIAVEKDSRLIPILKNEFKDIHNVEIVTGDVLTYSGFPEAGLLENGRYKIVANIPYYITSKFLRTVFEKWPVPKLIVLTIQNEVARRIMAKPPPKSGKAASGQTHMNLLALSVQYYSKPEIISYISKNNFRPVPKVDSAIIRLGPRFPEVELPLEVQLLKSRELFKLIRTGFSEKRKQLASVLSKKLKIDKEKILEAFKKEGIAPNIRAENLSLEQWQKLSKIF